MSFEKLPAIKAGGPDCLTCGCGAHDSLDMDRVLAVGFGDVTVTKNGQGVYSEQEQDHKANKDGDVLMWEAKDAEELAAKDPDSDWRIHFFAPLYEAKYQRQGTAHWVLIEKGDGFA